MDLLSGAKNVIRFYIYIYCSKLEIKMVFAIQKANLVDIQTRIGVFACGQILCISPNGLQGSHGIN